MTEAASVFDISTYPEMDRAKSIELAGGDESLANDLLTMFVDSLPDDIAAIRAAYDAQDYPELRAKAHRVHGALCYCVIPKMKEAVFALEKASIDADVPAINAAYTDCMARFDHFMDFIK